MLQSLNGRGPTRDERVRIQARPGTRWRYSEADTACSSTEVQLAWEGRSDRVGWPETDVAEYMLAEDVDPSRLKRFAGTYKWDGGTVTKVRFRDGRLWAQFNRGADLELHPLSSTRFVTTSDEIHEFVVDDSGKVTGLIWRSGDLVFRAKR